MKRVRQDSGYWILDYDWSQRGGDWSEFTDVLLLGSVGDDEGCRQALSEWIARQPRDRAAVDGRERPIFIWGGVRGYLDDGTVFLHSRGEDAFDSLSACSKAIADHLRRRRCGHGVEWREARHDRRDHQLGWPS